MEQSRLRAGSACGGIGGMEDPFAGSESALLALAGAVDRAAARRTVASRAIGAADLSMLLDMLGLQPEHDPPDAGTGRRTTATR